MPLQNPNPNYPAVGEGTGVAGGYDATGTYDFGPRVGKVTNLKINGRPATREEALRVIQQSQGGGLGGSIAQAEGERQQGLQTFTKSRETDVQMREAMRDLAPMALFPLLSRTGFIRGMAGGAAAGAAGGQAGEMVDQMTGSDAPTGGFTDWLSRRSEDAMMGAGTEGAGRLLGGATRAVGRVPRRLLGGALQDAPSTLRENVAAGHGIHFTPSQVLDEFSAATGKPAGTIIRGEESRAFHNPYSRSIAQSGARVRNAASRATVTGLINELGPDVPSNITGQRMAEVIQRVGKPTWQRQVEKLKSIVNARALGTVVDTAPLREAAENDLQELDHKLIGLGQVDDEGRPVRPNTAKVRMLQEVAAFPDQMPFSTLAAKRTDWMGTSPQMTELISGEAKGTAKHFTEISTKMLDEAAKGAEPDPFAIKTPPMSPAASKLHTDSYVEAMKTGSDVKASAGATSITLTPKEKDVLSWALDPMTDYWGDPEGDAEGGPLKLNEVVELQGNNLSLKGHANQKAVIEDLLYRLEDQAQNIQDSPHDKASLGMQKAARDLAKKLRAALDKPAAPAKSIGERAEAIRKAKLTTLINEYANEVRNAAAGVDPSGSVIKDPTDRIVRAQNALRKIQQAKQALIAGGVTANDLKTMTPPDLARAQSMLRDVFKRDIPTTRRGFEQEWNRFRNFTRKGADVFESQVITDAVNKNPEEVLRLVKGDDITDVLRVRRAIKGYGEMYGDVADQVKAAAAWKKFQVGYLRENVLGQLDGDMTRLQDYLEKLNPAVKKVIFDDPQSQSTLLRLTQVGKALKDADKNLGVLMGHQDPLADLNSQKGWIRSIRPYVVAKIAWNPTATRFFLRGLAGLSEAPPTDSKIKDFVSQVLVGKGAKAALKTGGVMTNRRLGAAMADIIRAYDIANIYDESKRQEKRADEFIQKAQTGKTTSVPEPQLP